ncbi:MAG: retropepsin-like aspartic protease [Hyphomicrobiales bacterium]
MKIKLPLEKISIQEDGIHLMVKGEINGTTATFLVDTGASRTVFDVNRISKFVCIEETEFEDNENLSAGLGTNSMVSQITTVKELKFGDLHIEDYDVVLLDLNHVNQSYEQLELDGIDGVLGSDLMDDYNAVVSYRESYMEFSLF